MDPLTIALILTVLFAANFGVESLKGGKPKERLGRAGISTATQAPAVFGAPSGAGAVSTGLRAFTGGQAGGGGGFLTPGGRTPQVIGPGQQFQGQVQGGGGGDFAALFQQLTDPKNLQLLAGLLQPQQSQQISQPAQLPSLQPAQPDATGALLAQLLQSQGQPQGLQPQAVGGVASPFTQRASQVLQPRFGITPSVR